MACVRAQSGTRCVFGTVDSFLLYKLTGGAVHATDYTNASRTMIYNIHRGKWDGELLEIFDIPAGILPDVRSSAGDFGATVDLGVLPAGIPLAGLRAISKPRFLGNAAFSKVILKIRMARGVLRFFKRVIGLYNPRMVC